MRGIICIVAIHGNLIQNFYLCFGNHVLLEVLKRRCGHLTVLTVLVNPSDITTCILDRTSRKFPPSQHTFIRIRENHIVMIQRAVEPETDILRLLRPCYNILSYTVVCAVVNRFCFISVHTNGRINNAEMLVHIHRRRVNQIIIRQDENSKFSILVTILFLNLLSNVVQEGNCRICAVCCAYATCTARHIIIHQREGNIRLAGICIQNCAHIRRSRSNHCYVFRVGSVLLTACRITNVYNAARCSKPCRMRRFIRFIIQPINAIVEGRYVTVFVYRSDREMISTVQP